MSVGGSGAGGVRGELPEIHISEEKKHFYVKNYGHKRKGIKEHGPGP